MSLPPIACFPLVIAPASSQLLNCLKRVFSLTARLSLSSLPLPLSAAFQWDDFAMKNNAELNDNLGNFINRTLKFCYAR